VPGRGAVSRRILALAVAALVAGCSTGASRAPSDDPRLRVVATTTVLADLVASIGGDRVAVASLVPKGGDVHTFDPRPSDVARVADAQLVVANGIGLDEWLTKLARDAGTNARIVYLADSVPKDQYIVEDGIPNPHLWLDPDDAALYVTAVRDALTALAPGDATVFDANLTAYKKQLTDLKEWGQAQFNSVAADRRQLIAFHDALPYMARAYGFEIAGAILKAPGQDPSAQEIAALVNAIRANHIRVVVSEVQFSDKLARTIASETGATIVSDLYDDSLGDPPVDSYLALVRYDLERLVNGLKGNG
jgi:ABC-type Zn uptake system ZnuABC Zn-binding protein ZnuA